MNVLKITLNEDGNILNYEADFKVMRGCYRNVLINIEVPHSLLVDPVLNGENNQTGNNVRIGAIIQTVTGHRLQTKRYELQWIKDYKLNGILYSLYQRRMPKEFTLWETVNLYEANNSGRLQLVINIINWVKENIAKIEEITASPILDIDIYPSAFLETEEMPNPSDLELLQSQVQVIDKELEDKVNSIELDAVKTSIDEKVSKDVYVNDKLAISAKIEQETSNALAEAKEYTDSKAKADKVYYGGNAYTVWTKYDTEINGGGANG